MPKELSKLAIGSCIPKPSGLFPSVKPQHVLQAYSYKTISSLLASLLPMGLVFLLCAQSTSSCSAPGQCWWEEGELVSLLTAVLL